jgi:hypothetical protein
MGQRDFFLTTSDKHVNDWILRKNFTFLSDMTRKPGESEGSGRKTG